MSKREMARVRRARLKGLEKARRILKAKRKSNHGAFPVPNSQGQLASMIQTRVQRMVVRVIAQEVNRLLGPE